MLCLEILPVVLVVLSIFAHNASALGIQFVTPGGGATLPPGSISVSWEDAGGNPDMSELVTYTLELVVGGNTAGNSESLQTIGAPNASVANGKVEDTVSANLAQSVENGFYLMMTSNTATGNQVINYSERFTLISMNGSTDAVYLNGANGAAGVTDVPEAQYNVISQPMSTTTSAPASTSLQPNPSTSTSTKATATPGPPPDDAQRPLSSGLVAGLSLGLLVAVVLLASIAIWALLRWRKKRKLGKMDTSQNNDGRLIGDKAELPATDVSPGSPSSPVELSPTAERYEVGGHDKAVEADGSREVVYELEGDWSGWEATNGRRSQAYDPTL